VENNKKQILEGKTTWQTWIPSLNISGHYLYCLRCSQPWVMHAGQKGHTLPSLMIWDQACNSPFIANPGVLISVNNTSLLKVAGHLIFVLVFGELLRIFVMWYGMEETSGLTSTQERGIALFVVNVAGLYAQLVHAGIMVAK